MIARRELECEIYMIVIMNLIIGLHNMNQVQGTGLKEVLNWDMHSRAIYAMHACYSCTMQSMCIMAHTRTEFQSQSLLLVSHKISHDIARIATINQARHIYFLISGACESIDIHTHARHPFPPLIHTAVQYYERCQLVEPKHQVEIYNNGEG